MLYKGGTASGAEVGCAAGLEPYSEYFAAQIAEVLGFDHVAYDLARFKGRLCSTCRLFTSERIGYLSAALVPDRRVALADSRFAETFLFDAIVFNTDRHLGNFGYLVDNETNEIIGAAPIFDNGYGLFSLMTLPEDYAADDFAPIQSYLRGKHPALFEHWPVQASNVNEIFTVETGSLGRALLCVDSGHEASGAKEFLRALP